MRCPDPPERKEHNMEDMLFGVLLGGFAVTIVDYIGIFLFLEIHDAIDHGEGE